TRRPTRSRVEIARGQTVRSRGEPLVPRGPPPCGRLFVHVFQGPAKRAAVPASVNPYVRWRRRNESACASWPPTGRSGQSGSDPEIALPGGFRTLHPQRFAAHDANLREADTTAADGSGSDPAPGVSLALTRGT